jgi:hypothetical protein
MAVAEIFAKTCPRNSVWLLADFYKNETKATVSTKLNIQFGKVEGYLKQEFLIPDRVVRFFSIQHSKTGENIGTK